jgi:hypothetical protein
VPTFGAILAIPIVSDVDVMVGKMGAEILRFPFVAPPMPMMVAIPVAIAVGEGGISERDAEVDRGGSRRGCNKRPADQDKCDKRSFDDGLHRFVSMTAFSE